MKAKTVGVSPKLIAAVIAAVLTYVLGQEVLELPAWAVVTGQAVLVALAVYSAAVGAVTLTDPHVGQVKNGGLGDNRGQAEPLTLLVYVIVVIILVVVLFKVLEQL